jgi:hypothetical protein
MRYSDVAAMHAAMKHEVRNFKAPLSDDFVYWAQLILNGRDAVSPNEVDAWRSLCETGEDLCEHLRHEARKLDKPITKEFVMWAQLVLFGRQGLPDDEIHYWIATYPRREDCLRAFWFQKNDPNAPLTSDLVRSAYAFILRRDSCADEDTAFWLGRCKTLKELSEHLLHEVVQERNK